MQTQFWIQMIVYAVSLGSLGGVVLTRLNYLEKKMDKHNNLIERVYEVEGQQKVQEEQIKVANHRIADLEGAK
jgi:hypothetical protein